MRLQHGECNPSLVSHLSSGEAGKGSKDRCKLPAAPCTVCAHQKLPWHLQQHSACTCSYITTIALSSHINSCRPPLHRCTTCDSSWHSSSCQSDKVPGIAAERGQTVPGSMVRSATTPRCPSENFAAPMPCTTTPLSISQASNFGSTPSMQLNARHQYAVLNLLVSKLSFSIREMSSTKTAAIVVSWCSANARPVCH